MERRLRSIHHENEIATTTLRQVAGEQRDNNAVDYFLRKKMAHTALFISAATAYEIDASASTARLLHDLSGGFTAYYDELQQLPIIRAARSSALLGVVEAAQVVALFTTQHVAVDDTVRLRRGSVLLGDMPQSIGLDLDQIIEIRAFTDLLPPPAAPPRLQVLR